jgi:serpin B
MTRAPSGGFVAGLLVTAVVLLSVACSPAYEPPTLEEIAARALEYTPSAEKSAVVEGSNTFGLELYSRLIGSRTGNVFLSPFSISSALAMAYSGARGDTATQMAATLHFDLAVEDLAEAIGALIADMGAVGARDGYELDIANGLWGQSGWTFLAGFLDVLEVSYKAPLREVDFQAPEAAREAINTWVEDATHDRILDLLPAGSIDALTRLVLANAIYFKGSWARTFDADDTRDGLFTLAGGEQVSVPMMHQEAELNYAENGLVQLLELPYATGDLSMVLVLPASGHDLAEVEAALAADPSELESWISRLSPANDLPVTIPSFSFTSGFALADQLRDLGMTDAFDGLADFSGITGMKDLVIGDVYHKAFVLVNEEGTEAAAATAVVFEATAMPTSFVADHPFIFLIRHNRSGAILFLGRVMDPRED